MAQPITISYDSRRESLNPYPNQDRPVAEFYTYFATAMEHKSIGFSRVGACVRLVKILFDKSLIDSETALATIFSEVGL